MQGQKIIFFLSCLFGIGSKLKAPKRTGAKLNVAHFATLGRKRDRAGRFMKNNDGSMATLALKVSGSEVVICSNCYSAAVVSSTVPVSGSYTCPNCVQLLHENLFELEDELSQFKEMWFASKCEFANKCIMLTFLTQIVMKYLPAITKEQLVRRSIFYNFLHSKQAFLHLKLWLVNDEGAEWQFRYLDPEFQKVIAKEPHLKADPLAVVAIRKKISDQFWLRFLTMDFNVEAVFLAELKELLNIFAIEFFDFLVKTIEPQFLKLTADLTAAKIAVAKLPKS
jgi:hypothetical protein